MALSRVPSRVFFIPVSTFLLPTVSTQVARDINGIYTRYSLVKSAWVGRDPSAPDMLGWVCVYHSNPIVWTPFPISRYNYSSMSQLFDALFTSTHTPTHPLLCMDYVYSRLCGEGGGWWLTQILDSLAYSNLLRVLVLSLLFLLFPLSIPYGRTL